MKHALLNVSSVTGNDIVPSDVYNELGEYNSFFGGSFPRPIIRGPIRGPIAIDRKRRSILPPRGGGGWADFNVSFFNEKLNKSSHFLLYEKGPV